MQPILAPTLKRVGTPNNNKTKHGMVMSVTVSFILAMCVIILCKFGWRVVRFLYLANKFPGPSLWELVTFHARHLLDDDLPNYLHGLCASYEYKPWGVWLYHNFLIVVSDCETMSEIYKKRETTDKPGLFYDAFATYTGHNILTSNGAEHRRNRKVLNPAVRKSHLESHLERINDEVLKFVARLRERATGVGEVVLDVRSMVKKLVSILVVSTFSSGTVPYEKLRGMFPLAETILEEVHLRSINPFYYWFVHKLKSSTRASDDKIAAMMDETKRVFIQEKNNTANKMREDGVTKARDFLQVLAMQHPDRFHEDGFSEARALIAAGFDTTAFTINISLLLLAMHPQVQERIFHQIESVLGRSDRALGPDDLIKLDELEMAIKETLRLFPPAPIILKRANRETNLSGRRVPRGGIFVLNLFALHRNPQIFKDPCQYDPARFSPQVSRTRHPFAFIPFSSGPRNCPGQFLAMMVIKTTLCHVIRNFEVSLDDRIEKVEHVKARMHFTFGLAESPLRFIRR